MIVILAILCGAAGAGIACGIAICWGGAAQLFGFTGPTPDQIGGLVSLAFGIGSLGSLVVIAAAIIWEEWRA